MKKLLFIVVLVLLFTPLFNVSAQGNYDSLSKYIIRAGDTLWSISQSFDVDISLLLNINPELADKNIIKVGQKLNVPTRMQIHKIHSGDTLWSISKRYKIDINKITALNNIKQADLIEVGTTLIIPAKKSYDDKNKTNSFKNNNYLRSSVSYQEDDFIWPTKYRRITSPFGKRWGRMHEGIDIAVPKGSLVKAAKSGRIIKSRYIRGYGNVIYIDHGSGIMTRYAHNSRLLVSEGEKVYKGQAIAYSGNTGRSTGPHLHFEIRINGQAVNPISYLD
ncbi:peptidoglycan DD-metalloendopeptidase family protein [Orenia marismortui]|uniref:peptidoglycan DD-metalloendopeptidase family protein n=1 Tax=Orenia marismortui TaxID=46469 RepID=UPI000374D40F|nr:M23 family metallopeptidase [Orenia marismortui]